MNPGLQSTTIEQMPNPERKPLDRLEAQDQPVKESKIGDDGKQKDPAYEIWRKLSEEFATAARLYAEVVAAFASSPLTAPRAEYDRLRKTAEEALGRSEAIGIAFENHVELQQRGCETPVTSGIWSIGVPSRSRARPA
jgi:cytochrome c peroxidase